MTYYERIGCIHIHSTYSDGTAALPAIGRVAAGVGLDYVIVTDHNTYVPEHQGWYAAQEGGAPTTLLLVGEEVHDSAHSQINHYLVLNAGAEVKLQADSPAQLVAAVRECGGLGFIAHPIEHSGAYTGEDEINWIDWRTRGYTGLELWNYMSEFKAHLPNLSRAMLYALWPKLAMLGPFPETLAKWDDLLDGGPVVALGGVDAHARTYHAGPVSRQVFSYAHLFRSLTTHLLLAEDWTHDVAHDAALVYEALSLGRAFIAYDALAPARGFAFTAEQRGETYPPGQVLPAGRTVRFRVHAPRPAHLRLILNGHRIAEVWGDELTHDDRTPGFYRVEAYLPYALKERGWVFTNPIYVR